MKRKSYVPSRIRRKRSRGMFIHRSYNAAMAKTEASTGLERAGRTISAKAASFSESVIREMTRLAMAHDAINLAQGFPDFPAPAEVKDAAIRAIEADVNQYAITWRARPFRQAIA